MRRHTVATIPGDGIGQEVIPAGVEVTEAAARKFGFDIKWTEFDWSCDRYRTAGAMMPTDGIAILKPFDAICKSQSNTPSLKRLICSVAPD